MLSYSTSGEAQNFFCDHRVTKPLCPGTAVQCTCTALGRSSVTRWLFKSPTTQTCIIQIPQVYPCTPSSTGACNPYMQAVGSDLSGAMCATSVVSVTAHPGISGLVVECRDYSTEEKTGLLVGNSTINTLGIHVYLYTVVYYL